MERANAWELLREYNKDHFHLQHALTVEAVMRWFASDLGYGAEADYWGMVGLLHDIDFELYPEQHCVKCVELLQKGGVPEDMIHAIVSHGYGICADVAPEREMEKVLFACDELTGLIWAAALMRPSKSTKDMDTDPKYALNFAKLRDSDTTLFEKHVVDVDINHGVFIDIFPFDGYVKGQNKVLDLRVKENPVFEESDTNIISNTLNGLGKKLTYKLGETIPNKLKTDLSKLSVPKDNPSFEESDYVACLVDSFYIIPFKKEFLGKGIKVDFEGIKVNAPENYDEYLKALYGDYMKLPPEDQRENHHNFHIADVNKSFREYQEKI